MSLLEELAQMSIGHAGTSYHLQYVFAASARKLQTLIARETHRTHRLHTPGTHNHLELRQPEDAFAFARYLPKRRGYGTVCNTLITDVTAMLELFPGFGSGVLLATEAVLLIPASFGVAAVDVGHDCNRG